MYEQCGLSIGSEMTSLNLQINGIGLKESLTDMWYHSFDHTI